MTAPAADSAHTQTLGIPPKTFQIVTTAQVERIYIVQARDEEQARARLRTHLADPDMLREGVVAQKKQIDTTPQRIKSTPKSTLKLEEAK